MAVFQVFIDGAADPSPQGVARLAAAMHERYRLDPAELAARLARGRFRVKGNIDESTAWAYARDLERLGARASVEEADAAPARATPAPAPPPPAPAAVRLASDPGAGRAAPAPSASASFDLPGNYDAPDNYDAPASSSVRIAVSPDARAAAAGAAPAGARPALEAPGNYDAPAAPEGPGAAISLAADELAHQARRRAPTPLADPEPMPGASSPVMRRSAASLVGSLGTAGTAGTAAGGAARPPLHRARFAAGVAVSILLGFVPAHFIAAARERAAFREIDAHVVAVQSRTDAPLDGAALASFRAEQQDRKDQKHRSIALASLAIWALAGAGLAYLWFRRVPWDRLWIR